MKLLLLALFVAVAYSAATNKKQAECAAKITQKCDADCLKKINDKCGPDSSVYKEDVCKDFRDKKPTDLNKEWSTKVGEDFHACSDKCIDELSGDAKKYSEKQKACDANVLSFAALAVVLLALLF